MKRGIGIGTIVIIGLIVWWLTRNRQAEAADVGESEYEKLHKVVPITEFVKKEVPVYSTIEAWEANHG